MARKPVSSRLPTIVVGLIQRLAQIPSSQLRRRHRHLVVDHPLLRRSGAVSVGRPQLLAAGPGTGADLLSPQPVASRLLTLPRPLLALLRELVTIIGSTVALRSSPVPTFGDVVAVPGVT